jgi:hypothetical protein
MVWRAWDVAIKRHQQARESGVQEGGIDRSPCHVDDDLDVR